ncbi:MULTISPECIES: hypothetical protein [unclassified Kitasatospora]|uniref:hypothetical protein n=1 Tax=unclassified Kitasatospora TaxID=2633591 RepID=UPI002475D09C|nr:hypothetical protein [Kitasatospora sp. MAP12-44]
MADAKRQDPPRAFPVFLGGQQSSDLGVPTWAEIGRSVFQRLATRSRPMLSKLPGDWPQSSDEQVSTTFAAWLRERGPMQRYSVLEPFFRSVPVPLYYRDLAELVAASYVRCVLTVNIDTLFEQALDSVGLRRDTDYAVIVPGHDDCASPRAGPTPPITVVKLLGDVGHSLLPIGGTELGTELGRELGTELEETLRTVDTLCLPQPPGDLIVVAHQIADPPQPIDEWLTRWPKGDLWWVYPSPDLERLAPLMDSRAVTLLDGEEAGRPGGFFGRLNLHLIRLPALSVADALPDDPEALSRDQLEYQYYKGQLLKSRAVSFALQQKRVPGVVEEPLEHRVLYQQQVEADLEDRFRSAQPDVRPGLLDSVAHLLGELVAQVAEESGPGRQALPEPSAVAFLRAQAAAAEQEAGAASPDLGVVRGALEAARTCARQSLGDSVPRTVMERLTAASREFDLERSS